MELRTDLICDGGPCLGRLDLLPLLLAGRQVLCEVRVGHFLSKKGMD